MSPLPAGAGPARAELFPGNVPAGSESSPEGSRTEPLMGTAAAGAASFPEESHPQSASAAPVDDFLQNYRRAGFLRLHMPGHKGCGETEALDITEIRGADPLYPARGILRQSEENAAELFGAGRTLYSAEGSSLCIRAMLLLVRMRAARLGLPPLIVAGRNAHSSFLSAAALLGLEIRWLRGQDLLSCLPSGEDLASVLDALPRPPAAVYLTSPDYLGRRTDLPPLSALCRARGIPLLVDNAHGAYLRFLPAARFPVVAGDPLSAPAEGMSPAVPAEEASPAAPGESFSVSSPNKKNREAVSRPPDLHPLSCGADMTCDSAHKTLPVLTGGAYLHIRRDADPLFAVEAERALAVFASTSPSWLILRSLDLCNVALRDGYPARLAAFAEKVSGLKSRLTAMGYDLAGDEPLKITLAPKSRGYTGNALHDLLRAERIECEFSDPDYLVMMLSPQTGPEGLEKLESALRRIPRRPPVPEKPPRLPDPDPVLSPAEALLSPAEEVPLAESRGRILADPCVSCPPAVPILVSGERIGDQALRCFAYYGISSVLCVANPTL